MRPDARPQALKNRRRIRWNTLRIFSGRERRRWLQIIRRSRTVNVGQAPKGRWQASFTSKTIQELINPAKPDTKGQRAKGTGLQKVLDETEAEAVVPDAGKVPVPVGNTQELRYVEPGTATAHARRI